MNKKLLGFILLSSVLGSAQPKEQKLEAQPSTDQETMYAPEEEKNPGQGFIEREQQLGNKDIKKLDKEKMPKPEKGPHRWRRNREFNQVLHRREINSASETGLTLSQDQATKWDSAATELRKIEKQLKDLGKPQKSDSKDIRKQRKDLNEQRNTQMGILFDIYEAVKK